VIIITVELWSAVTHKKHVLGQAIIANDGTETSAKLGSYDVKVARKSDVGDFPKIWRSPLRQGRVEKYPRLSYNIWRLVSRALRVAFPEEK